MFLCSRAAWPLYLHLPKSFFLLWHLPYGQQPSLCDFTLIWGHRISSSLENTSHSETCYYAFVCHGAEMFALGMNGHNAKECKVRPPHDIHYCLLASPGQCAHQHSSNTLQRDWWRSSWPTQTQVGMIFFKTMNSSRLCTRQGRKKQISYSNGWQWLLCRC